MLRRLLRLLAAALALAPACLPPARPLRCPVCRPLHVDVALTSVLSKTGNPSGWHFRELGGAGERAFLAIAASLSWQRWKSLDSAALGRKAARLRLLACDHLGKHQKEYEPAWAPRATAAKGLLVQWASSQGPLQAARRSPHSFSVRWGWLDASSPVLRPCRAWSAPALSVSTDGLVSLLVVAFRFAVTPWSAVTTRLVGFT